MNIFVGASVKVRGRRFEAGRFTAAARQSLVKATAATAFAVKARAIPEIPVDTGFAKNSVYVKLPGRSEYESARDASVAALGAAPAEKQRAAREFLPETSEGGEETEVRVSGAVAMGAEYGFWLHEGARGRPGVPFFAQAAADEQVDHERRVAAALDEGFRNA